MHLGLQARQNDTISIMFHHHKQWCSPAGPEDSTVRARTHAHTHWQTSTHKHRVSSYSTIMMMIKNNQDLIRTAAKWHTSSRLLITTCEAVKLHYCPSTGLCWIVLGKWFIPCVCWGLFVNISVWGSFCKQTNWMINPPNIQQTSLSSWAVYIDSYGRFTTWNSL